MSLMKLEVGQGIKFSEVDKKGKESYKYGLIIKATDRSIEFF